uniref:DH domain-containing protein n=1 Tax=Branchiostoma floridae TaxID=7739 RepID=C3ZNT7_BRAFL|eukprot:XP_002589808.1 hypothetical protein BRAFLDRAFT_90496 [Branchiostoma floridae]
MALYRAQSDGDIPNTVVEETAGENGVSSDSRSAEKSNFLHPMDGLAGGLSPRRISRAHSDSSHVKELSTRTGQASKLCRQKPVTKSRCRPRTSVRTSLDGEDGMRVKDLVADAILEYRLTDYRVTMSSTKAILNPDANALMLRGEDILIEDLSSQIEAIDPRLAGDARFRVVHELMVTERNYIDALKSIFDIYAEPLRKFSSLSQEDYKVLFSGLEPLLSLSRTVYKKLEDSVPTWDTDHTAVGNIFSKQLWSQYDEYYMSYKETRMLLRQKRETDEEFLEFCNIRRGAARHSIDSLLLLPVQRVPQYNKILSDLLKETPSDHPDFDDLTKAANRVQKMVTEREEEVNFAENEMKMMQVQERFPHDDLALYEKEKLSIALYVFNIGSFGHLPVNINLRSVTSVVKPVTLLQIPADESPDRVEPVVRRGHSSRPADSLSL